MALKALDDRAHQHPGPARRGDQAAPGGRAPAGRDQGAARADRAARRRDRRRWRRRRPTRLAEDSKIKLEEQIKRRGEMAERRIALAEAQAAAEVKAAAADLAAQAAEAVLAARLAGAKSDPLAMPPSPRWRRSCSRLLRTSLRARRRRRHSFSTPRTRRQPRAPKALLRPSLLPLVSVACLVFLVLK